MGVAAIVWGVVGIRMLTSLQKKDSFPIYSNDKITEETFSDENFTLLLDYPSPFTIKPSTTKVRSATSRITSRLTRRNVLEDIPSTEDQVVEETVVEWPNIEYLGVSDKNYLTNETVLLSIDGETQMVERNAIQDGLRIMQLYDDSIKLYYQGETQTFILQ